NASWNIRPVTQSQKTGTAIASVVDKSNNDYQVHVVYNNTPLKQVQYAVKKLGQWTYEIIENNRLCTSADIQLDKNQNPVVLYNDKLSNQTRLARKNGNQFIFETVNPSIAGDYINLKFSPTKDTLHACFYDLSINTLVYGRKIGSNTWTFEFPEIVGVEIAGEFPSLTIDGDGLPHIVYYDRRNTQLKHAFKTLINPNWQKEVIVYDANIDQGSFCKSIIGPNNVVQAAWVNKNANQIEYAKKVLGAWQRDTVISQTVGLVGMPLAMTTDDSSSAWICYNVQNALPEVRIARKGFNQTQWGSTPVGKNSFQLGNVFDFELLDSLIFITGRTNRENELGIGLLTGVLSFNVVSNDSEIPIQVTVYPNPFQNFIFIETSGINLQNETIQILDLNGKLHLERKLEPRISLDLGELPSGMYLVKIGNTVQKIVKL
ncbi:MAG: T9SS type A sorting domain-containing protein, partial [Bacteroidia bacterium]|nr:T9SS type A sorting domain-containing protein [Bacteroidia bacterium]